MDRIWIGYGLDTSLSDYVISISNPISNPTHVIHGYTIDIVIHIKKMTVSMYKLKQSQAKQ
jgi:hypothetical protein